MANILLMIFYKYHNVTDIGLYGDDRHVKPISNAVLSCSLCL
jgi:hypothetical protein